MRVDPASFEATYAGDADPWDFATSEYEQHRYDAIESLLRPGPTFRRCFEPGCSIGVLTERLARRCAQVVAVDPSPSAVSAAALRLEPFDNVELSVGSIPEWWPSGSFDLVVFSELGYYWDEAGLAEVVRRLSELREPGGDLVAAHWLGESADHVLHGSVVQQVLVEALGRPAAELEGGEFVAAAWR